jgi:hypothetical protein
LSGCSVGLPPEVAQLGYVNRQERFAMDVPAGWTVRESGGTAAVIVTAPAAADGIRANVTVTVTPADYGQPLETCVTGAKQGLAKLNQFKLVSEGSRTLADGSEAYAVTFQQTFDKTPLVQRQLYTQANGMLYTVTATASPQDFAAEEAHFDICFNSFRGGWR